ncbi:MAG: UV DNA damage repair endonuclease UvsE [Eubacteriales bacterium]|nr:UV DNA damage repair endonuclease UvsE [Eubacteriales bacterium]
MKTTILKHATQERLYALISQNLAALEVLIDYNIKNGIRLFRISSDLVPFGSSAAKSLPWRDQFAEALWRIGGKIRSSGMRVSMHPGQYTVLNALDPVVAKSAELDLDYHCQVLDAMGLGPEHKLILHLGGAYGDREASKARFISRWRDLSPAVQSRLAIENDDRVFTIRDALDVSWKTGIPVVYDNLHNAVNPADPGKTDLDWIRESSITWQGRNGRQKIHYSQQDPGKRPGAHSATVRIGPFLRFQEALEGTDIMLEVKDKNLSAIKCINCTSNQGIAALEAEWGRYKYAVLERDPNIYQAIRQLLKDKAKYPALEMYQLIEEALAKEPTHGSAVNAAQHVWGYFKDRADTAEKRRWETAMRRYREGSVTLLSLKSALQKLSIKYKENYLNGGYYFVL